MSTTHLDLTAWTITEIHDTRDIEARGDRLVRVAGTGTMRACDACGAGHEIHSTITDGRGNQLVVGGSCARGLARSTRVTRSYRIGPPVKVAAGAGWVAHRMTTEAGVLTDQYRLTGTRAADPTVITAVERMTGGTVIG